MYYSWRQIFWYKFQCVSFPTPPSNSETSWISDNWIQIWHYLPGDSIGLAQSPFSIFLKIKDAFFVFTNNFIVLNILRMSTIFLVVEHWLFSINVSIWLLSTSTGLPDHGASSSEKSPAWNFTNCFDTFSQSQHLLHTLHESFFWCFSCIFTFLDVIKHNTPKMLHIIFHHQY